MIREFSNQFTLQLKKVLLGSVLVFTALILGACSGDTTGNGNGGGNGGGGTTPPVYSPSFDLGTTFTIASLDDKNFARDTDNISKYSIEDVSSADTSKELIETQLKANIKTKLEKNITGTAVTFGDVGITGNAVAEDTLTVTVATTITETSTSTNTATNTYTFTIGFAKELVKWDGSELEITPVDGVYKIYNGSHLAWIAKQTRLTAPNTFATKTVRFMNSVDMDNNNSASGKVFTGIDLFKGRLEGNHKTIYGLKIVKEENDVGLISKLGTGGYIDNLRVASGQIKGNRRVGAFVGQVESSEATIEGVTNHATVEGTLNNVGGLVGSLYTGTLTIDNSSNIGNVTGAGDNIGGLVGEVTPSTILIIDNSSNIGNVTGASDYVGGLVGGNNGTATITNSHSYAKKVTATGGTTSAGGIVGRIFKDRVTANNVYWLHDGSTGIAGAVGVNSGTFTNTGEKSKALTIAEFKVSTNFNGWDFVKVWEIVNSLYPTLKKPVATP